ncbi:MAG: GAF domain-containing protein [candidate division KSB1 bacterium]|nr:GAF domain-containing protein [candidate division KSB1 bacterium]MDZ7319003.1 GAF domain-containing protein [candidate division KSB1 bacterium]MDZ7342015.1 GAF domain-containing protein [candidate division KSB1 bacterium]
MEWDSENLFRTLLSEIIHEIQKTVAFNVAALAINPPGSSALQVAISTTTGKRDHFLARTFPDAYYHDFKLIKGFLYIERRSLTEQNALSLELLSNEWHTFRIRSHLILTIAHKKLGVGALLIGSYRRELIAHTNSITEAQLNAIIDLAIFRLFHDQQLEEKYNMEDNLFKSIFEKSPLPTLIFKRDGSILLTNEALQQLYGRPISPATHHINLEDLFHWPQRKQITNQYRHLDPQDRFSIETILISYNNDKQPVQLTINPLNGTDILLATIVQCPQPSVGQENLVQIEQRQLLVNEINLLIHANLNKEQLINCLFNQIRRIFPYEAAAIILCDNEERELSIYYSQEPTEVETSKGLRALYSACQKFLFSGNRIEQNAEAIANICELIGLQLNLNYETQLIIRFKADEEPLGAMLLFHSEANMATKERLEILQQVGGAASNAYAKVRLIEKYQQSLTNYSLVARVNESLNSTLNLQSVLQHIVESIQQIMQARICTIRILDEKISPSPDELFDHFTPQIKQVIAEQKPLLIENLDYNNLNFFRNKTNIQQLGLRSLIVYPIVGDGKTVALLSVFFDRSHSFREHELELLSMLSHQAAIAINNARLYQEIEYSKSYLDSILGSSADMVVATMLDGTTSFFSQSAQKLTGFTADDVLEQPLFERLVKNGQAVFSGLKQILLSSEFPYVCEFEIINKQHESIPIAWSFSLLTSQQHEILGILGIGRDVSKYKRIDSEIKKQSEALKRLVTSISQSLATPINTTLGLVEVLVAEYAHALPGNGCDLVTQIQSNLKIMGEMVGELIKHSEGETKPLAPTSRTLEISVYQ